MRQWRMSLEESDDDRNNEGQPYHPDQPQEIGRAALGFRGFACFIWIADLRIFQLLVLSPLSAKAWVNDLTSPVFT